MKNVINFFLEKTFRLVYFLAILYVFAVGCASYGDCVDLGGLITLSGLIGISLLLATFLLVRIYIDLLFPLINPKKNNGNYALKNFLENMIDIKDSVDDFSRNIRKGLIKINDKKYERHLKEIEEEFYDSSGRFFTKIRKRFLFDFLTILVLLVLFFASCHVYFYTLDTKILGSGDQNSGLHYYEDDLTVHKKEFSYWFFNGIYFSVSTASTGGFGDIHPSTSIKTRSLVIAEFISFMILLSISLTFALGFYTDNIYYTTEHLKKTLSKKLKNDGRLFEVQERLKNDGRLFEVQE